jgi:hypothetical protein
LNDQSFFARSPGPSNFIRTMGILVIALSVVGAIALIAQAVSSDESCDFDSFTGELSCVPSGLQAVGITTGIAIALYGTVIGSFMIVFAALAENVAVIAQSNIQSTWHAGQVAAGLQSGTKQLGARECPFCKEPVRRDASVCPSCQRESAAWRFYEEHWWVRDQNDQWVYLDEDSGEWRKSEEPDDEGGSNQA